ncbi:MAG: hypothetical protein FJ304_18660 [Planctomycetes bacterium]|nr:hypothetical protein [Planctomycetota bacterium]
MNPRWTRLQELLGEFQTLLTGQVPKLEIQDGFVDNLETRSLALKKPGVYFLFDAASVLKYVGSATNQPMIDRIRTYFGSDSRLPFTPKYVDIVPFEWEWCFFAPALELYLIQKIECQRLLASGDKLLNTVGMIAGLREWFNLTYGAALSRTSPEAEPVAAPDPAT